MRTDTLIRTLAVDVGSGPTRGVNRRIAAAFAIAAPVSALLLLATLGLRPDVIDALATWRFDLKLTIVLAAAASAAVACARAALPIASSSRALALVVPCLLVGAVAIETTLTPSENWIASMRGRNALLCLAAIPALSLLPLTILMNAMRSGASAAPTRAGTAAGTLAAALGAGLYALHCVDDSPLFVAVWYPLASLPVIALGRFLGGRLLRW